MKTRVQQGLTVACIPAFLLLAQSSALWNHACMWPEAGQGQDAGVWALQNDFTPEEEEEVRRESQWAFD